MKTHAIGMKSIPPPPECVLVIDDQEQNIRVVGTLLTSMGYEVIPASSAEQAFERLAVRLPDLILLDMLMPGLDGLETCRRLKNDPRWTDLPIIFLSAADDKNLVVQALESGGADYVTKPFNKAELLSRVRTHLALKKARDVQRHLIEDKDELLGILAHDLKNHLAGMKLSASLLADRAAELPPRCATLASNIAESTDRMLAFVKEFLANQSAEQLVLRPGPQELKTLASRVIAEHRPAAALKEITIASEWTDDSLRVRADAEALRQVLDNLVSNAVKFSPKGGAITVSCALRPGGYAQCTVRDEGPGFTEEDRARLFSRYGRLSARPTGNEPSTGLGLSIVKRLIEAQKGRITLDSQPGQGALFTVIIPLAEAPVIKV